MIWRLRHRSTFAELRRDGARASRGPLTVLYLPDTLGRPPCVGYAITRRVGTAVVRNRLRRRLRAAVAEVAAGSHALSSGSYLLAARPPAVGLSMPELRSDVTAVLRLVSDRAAERMVTS